MAYIYLEGKTQSNDPSPSTSYKYDIKVTNRRADKVHVKLSVSVRMKLRTNFFSFRIAHECRVLAWPMSGNSLVSESSALAACRKSGTYQYADIKKTRAFWGHQWAGSYNGGGDFGWTYGSPDYDGDVWHGPFVVFDKDVPCEVGTTKLVVIPCITQPPITGLGGTGIYAVNRQDVNNWHGFPGYWRPFGVKLDGVAGYEDIGSRSTANFGPMMTEDGSFLNNKAVEMLDPKLTAVSRYVVPAAPLNLSASPVRIDVANQSASISTSWSDSALATRYKVDVRLDKVNSDGSFSYSKTVSVGYVKTKTGVGPVVFPRRSFPGVTFMDGDKLTVTVTPYDKNGVAGTRATSNSVTYFEVPSTCPQFASISGMFGVRNRIVWNGEPSAELVFGGWTDGSYPIESVALVILGFSDGVRDFSKDVFVGSWRLSQMQDVSGYSVAAKSVLTMVPAVKRPEVRVMELRAYDSRGRMVYYSGDQQGYRWDVEFTGGLMWVYSGNDWKLGVAYVMTDSGWKMCDRVHVFDGSEWETNNG